MPAYPLQELKRHFFEDPRWSGVEEMLRTFIEPLLDMSTVDTSLPAEDVRAEIIGRKLAYKQLDDFLNQVKILGSPKRQEDTKSPYR